MIQGLNTQQQQAVSLANNKHALVLAGAGSGKTRVLTTRMAWLIQDQHISPYAIMAVTFTNKAAREMLTRLTAQLPINTKGIWIGTFHGLCNRFLRAHFKDAGLLQTFQILDSSDQQSVIKRLIKDNNLDDKVFVPKDVQYFINNAKENGERAHHLSANDHHHQKLIDLYQQYQVQCDRESVVDFAELLLRSVELLEKNDSIRTHYQQRFKHILVDEFQDTNNLQYKWLTLLAGGGSSIFAVGDDDQSIYAFRGANVQNMASFQADYARENVIKLEQNYRSYGHILDAANALIANNHDRLGKNLWTEKGHGDLIRVVEQPSDILEAQWIVEEIKSLIGQGYPQDEISIVYRSNAQSRAIEHQLFNSGISYKVYGGMRFFERQEVKHALAYLRLMDNPDDNTAFLRVVNFPTRGIGLKSQQQLQEIANEHGISLFKAVAFMPGRAGSNLIKFVKIIESMAYFAQSMPLPDVIENVLEHSGLAQHYKTDKDGKDRLENLHELISAAAAFVIQEGWDEWPAGRIDNDVVANSETGELLVPLSPLAAFLSHASLEAGDNQAQPGDNAVQLMTIHSAKGLEFKVVFVAGLEEGLFPHENSLMEIDGLDEERRLMYVAITRAQEKLYLTMAQSRMLHGKTRYATRSCFLEEIPDEHLNWLTPKDNRIASSSTPSWSGAFRRGGNAYAGNSMTPVKPKSSTSVVVVNNKEFRIGQPVNHAKFGDGVIIALSGNGDQAQAQIHFQDVGSKTLALGIAKLN